MQNPTQESLSEALAHLSHEFRSPLAGILGFAELLGGDSASAAERAEYVHFIRQSCRALQDLTQRLLDWRKLESGCTEFHTVPVPLRERIAEAIQPHAWEAERKRLDFSVSWESTLPTEIETDPLRLWQVLNNLLGNALKFTETGWVRLHVRAADGAVHIDVEDSGLGIGAIHHERLFQPFSRFHPHAATTGHGLGLALSKGFCVAQGGDLVLLRSAPGEGSIFRIILPLRVTQP